MADEIITELWRIKDQLAREFNYDVVALAREMQRRGRASGRPLVDLSCPPPPAAAIIPTETDPPCAPA